MKKLKLKLDGKEMLTKQQMKKITGGYYDCFCNDDIHYKQIGAPDECEGAPVDCYDECVIFCADYGGV